MDIKLLENENFRIVLVIILMLCLSNYCIFNELLSVFFSIIIIVTVLEYIILRWYGV